MRVLTGFLKNPRDRNCICRIVVYDDRIWLDEKGDASIYRCFTIEVNKNSPSPLSEVLMFIPFKHVSNPKDQSETFFIKDFHLNDKGLAGQFKIQKISEPISKYGGATALGASLGFINDDGFENIKVFTGSSIQISPFFDLMLLTYLFPIPLEAGDLCEVRISFNITSLFENMTASTKFPSFEFIIKYFDERSCKDAVERMDRELEIPVIPTLGPPKGGFDVMVYFPSGFRIGRCNPQNAEIRIDKTHFDGMRDIHLTRYLWRARNIYPQATELRIGKTPFTLECTNVTPPDRTAEDIDEMKTKTTTIDDRIQTIGSRVQIVEDTTKKVKKEVKLGTWLAIIAIILALIIPIGIEIYKYYSEGKYKKETTPIVQPENTNLPKSSK